jgi:hypothetical protein
MYFFYFLLLAFVKGKEFGGRPTECGFSANREQKVYPVSTLWGDARLPEEIATLTIGVWSLK